MITVSLLDSERRLQKYFHFGCSMCKKRDTNKYIKHYQKSREMYIGMAMPKTIETRYRDGRVQARQNRQSLHK